MDETTLLTIIQKKMKDEAWLKKIQEQLENYSEPLPPSGWEQIERELAPRKPIIHLYRWSIAVAALLVGALSLIGLRLADNNPISPIMPIQSTTKPVLADILPSTSPIEHRLPTTLQPGIPPKTSVMSAMKPEKSNEISSSMEDKNKKEEGFTISSNTDMSSSQHTRTKKAKLPSTNESLLAEAKQAHKSSKGWSVGLSIGNTGGLTDLSANNMPLQQSAPGTNYLNFNLATTSEQVIDIPHGQELIFKNGLPYLQNRTRQVISAKHKQPISAGFSIRKNLPKGFSIESGLVYTYLSSDILYEGSTEAASQKLHYLGIPLRANWNFVDKKRFTLYVSAGGTIEKCIYGKIDNETKSIDPLQLSIMASIGAQYNLSKHVGLYIEPGISYFFNDGSDILTIRKDNPCNFTLQAGLRLSY